MGHAKAADNYFNIDWGCWSGGWKYASEIRIMNLETSLAAHSNREAHHDAAGRLIRLETQFSYIHDELAEIRKILEDGER